MKGGGLYIMIIRRVPLACFLIQKLEINLCVKVESGQESLRNSLEIDLPSIYLFSKPL